MGNLNIGGDFNFSVSEEAIWGSIAREEKLAHFFIDQSEQNGLIDVEPVKIRPTWNNNRNGEEGIAKTLDRFLSITTLLRQLVCTNNG
jgi:hypothetical protein